MSYRTGERPPHSRLDSMLAVAPPRASGRFPPVLVRALALVEARASDIDGCDLGAIAAELHVSREHLSRLFRRELGQTYSRWRTTVRLRHAIALVAQQPYRPLTRVAHECGFASLRTFEMQFRRAFDMTPREYRKEVRAWYRRDGGGGEPEKR